MYDIENTAKGYQELIDEIEKEKKDIDNHVIYMITGVVGSKVLSEQEYNVFIERALNHRKFEDIALTLGIKKQVAWTYYQRAVKKLENTAKDITYKFKAR